MLHDVIVVLLTVGLEYLLLKTWSLVAPASFTAAVLKVFPTAKP